MRERKERGGPAAARAPTGKLSRSGLLGGFDRVCPGFRLMMGFGLYDLLRCAGFRSCACIGSIMSRRSRCCRGGSRVGGKGNSRRQQHKCEYSSFSNHHRLLLTTLLVLMRDRETVN